MVRTPGAARSGANLHEFDDLDAGNRISLFFREWPHLRERPLRRRRRLVHSDVFEWCGVDEPGVRSFGWVVRSRLWWREFCGGGRTAVDIEFNKRHYLDTTRHECRWPRGCYLRERQLRGGGWLLHGSAPWRSGAVWRHPTGVFAGARVWSCVES